MSSEREEAVDTGWFRPWHAVLLGAFLVATVPAVVRDSFVGSSSGLGSFLVLLVRGLLAVVLVQVTLGSVWGYAREYRASGGEWADAVFVGPVGMALLAATASAVTTLDSGGSLWSAVLAGGSAAFWVFAGAVFLVNVGVRALVNYREGRDAVE
ncbi:MAG: hypothetical protein ABEH80_04630 [Halobaculum sp.]